MLEDILMKEFMGVFSVEERLQPMNCPPMSIHLKPGAIPTYTSTSRKIGPSLKPPTKKELDDMVAKKIIEEVPVDYVTDWCAPFCPREKESGEIRPAVDFRGLNASVQRPAHPITTLYNNTVQGNTQCDTGIEMVHCDGCQKQISPDTPE